MHILCMIEQLVTISEVEEIDWRVKSKDPSTQIVRINHSAILPSSNTTR